MNSSRSGPYILGLDLGSSSLGWAVIGLNPDGEPVRLERCGVRIFDPGVAGTELDILQGKDESRAAKRRQMRLQRRQMRRRAARQRDLFELLQANGLMPPYPEPLPEEPPHLGNARRSLLRHDILARLDAELFSRWKGRLRSACPRGADHVLPYFLRACALDKRLEPHELGRALYHLGQRRGFLSNRKQSPRTDEQKKELGKVYEGISALQKDMHASGARTLGEFFSRLDPTAARIRQRYTHRHMYREEFEKIWQAQAAHYPAILTPELKRQMEKLLFYQRPISAQTHLVGECELEPGRKRAPLACLAAQRFRLLQKVNDLKIRYADFTERPLEREERDKLIATLEAEGDQSFAQIRKLLELPSRGVWFNLERGGEKKIPGNRTAQKMRAAFGERWEQLSPTERDEAVEDWRTAESEEWLVRRGISRWGLSEEQARIWADPKNGPEDGYLRLSRKALSKLLPLMEEGFPFKEAEKEVYGTRFSGGEPDALLPPVRDALPALRNPAVERALTELRKVVNAILREYGRPAEIHIELARELKNPREARKEIWKAMRARQDLREKKKEELLQEIGIARPSRDDIERLLLWEECNGICPYTGRSIRLKDLFGDHPQFDVEHILPFQRCPDNSFANKTLCYSEENRSVKRGRTPWEAYGHDPVRWEEILNRVRRFKRLAGPSPARAKKEGKQGQAVGAPGKLKRFLVKNDAELAEFSSRQLQDTRYASKLAARYLGRLFGGRDELLPDGTTRQRIFTSPGGLTAELRRNWGLESILGEADPASSEPAEGKARSDHRHHAIDAIAIALTSPRAIKAASDAAARNARRGRVSLKGIEAPWPDFVESIRPHIESLVVSHRPEHKLTGQLHDETIYSPPIAREGKTYVHVRKRLENLSAGEVEEIVNEKVREAVKKRIAELGSLKKLQTAGVEPPYLETRHGKRVPIRSVRIRTALTTATVGEGPRTRHVAPKNNHHTEIIAELDKKGNEVRWEGVPVSLLEATERHKRGESVVKRNHGSETEYRFKFSLMGGDTVELQKDGSTQIYVVRTIATNGQLSLVGINDARKIKEIKEKKEWWSPRADALRKLNARKVVVDFLGRVHPAND
jgi:CRISPR-associated endonuclease Csn1